MPGRARVWLFFAIILLASAVGLVRLHATGGYCTVRHGLVPGMILILGAARGLTWLMERISVPGKWFGLAQEAAPARPRGVGGRAAWSSSSRPGTGDSGHPRSSPFDVYYETGAWLAQNTRDADGVLDLTDWSLFFSSRPGYRFAHVYDALADPQVRWIVLRKPHLEGHWIYSKAVRELVADREPAVLVPADPRPGELQLRIYDRFNPADRISAAAGQSIDPSARR